MAATWNPELMKSGAEISAMETRAAGIPWSFSPVLDIGRQPVWPRFYETFGEDPYLAKVMGVAFVRGMEGSDVGSQDHVATSLKHYIGYSFSFNGRDRTPAWIPENYLREYFLPTFDAAVKAGARTVMVNSAEINGVPGHINRHILTDILRDELGFKGFVVSDWEDIKKLVTVWRVAATEKDATRMAVMAGIDMSMVPLDYSFADNLIALVKEGAVPQSRIDEAVRRILRVKFELGLFENPGPDAALKSRIGLPASRQDSLQGAHYGGPHLDRHRASVAIAGAALQHLVDRDPDLEPVADVAAGLQHDLLGVLDPLLVRFPETWHQAIGVARDEVEHGAP
jgi:beta-glucosidase